MLVDFHGVQRSALMARTFGLTTAEIQAGLAAVPPLPRRFVIHTFDRGLTLIDDAWHATPGAMQRGLQSAAQLAGERRKVAVLGAMIQLERESERLHREMGAFAVACGFSDLLAFGSDQRAAWIRDGAVAAGLPPERAHVVAELQAVQGALKPYAASDTLIYCKAHREIGPELDAFRGAAAQAGFEPRS
jgi:UDP-N-acetylmuramoyl-tripeptide--D-alanyl-D-alanine ligase